MHEPEAAKLLAIKQNTLRAMRRDGRVSPGDHYIFATGNLGGPVVTAAGQQLVDSLRVESDQQPSWAA